MKAGLARLQGFRAHRRRAAAVTQVLATKLGVDAARLSPQGVGPIAPVAANDSEEGRAKNRRVELVKQ